MGKRHDPLSSSTNTKGALAQMAQSGHSQRSGGDALAASKGPGGGKKRHKVPQPSSDLRAHRSPKEELLNTTILLQGDTAMSATQLRLELSFRGEAVLCEVATDEDNAWRQLITRFTAGRERAIQTLLIRRMQAIWRGSHGRTLINKGLFARWHIIAKAIADEEAEMRHRVSLLRTSGHRIVPKLAAVRRIQRFFRHQLNITRTRMLHEAAILRRHLRASLLIQRNWRGYVARCKFGDLVNPITVALSRLSVREAKARKQLESKEHLDKDTRLWMESTLDPTRHDALTRDLPSIVNTKIEHSLYFRYAMQEVYRKFSPSGFHSMQPFALTAEDEGAGREHIVHKWQNYSHVFRKEFSVADTLGGLVQGYDGRDVTDVATPSPASSRAATPQLKDLLPSFEETQRRQERRLAHLAPEEAAGRAKVVSLERLAFRDVETARDAVSSFLDQAVCSSVEQRARTLILVERDTVIRALLSTEQEDYLSVFVQSEALRREELAKEEEFWREKYSLMAAKATQARLAAKESVARAAIEEESACLATLVSLSRCAGREASIRVSIEAHEIRDFTNSFFDEHESAGRNAVQHLEEAELHVLLLTADAHSGQNATYYTQHLSRQSGRAAVRCAAASGRGETVFAVEAEMRRTINIESTVAYTLLANTMLAAHKAVKKREEAVHARLMRQHIRNFQANQRTKFFTEETSLRDAVQAGERGERLVNLQTHYKPHSVVAKEAAHKQALRLTLEDETATRNVYSTEAEDGFTALCLSLGVHIDATATKARCSHDEYAARLVIVEADLRGKVVIKEDSDYDAIYWGNLMVVARDVIGKFISRSVAEARVARMRVAARDAQRCEDTLERLEFALYEELPDAEEAARCALEVEEGGSYAVLLSRHSKKVLLLAPQVVDRPATPLLPPIVRPPSVARPLSPFVFKTFVVFQRTHSAEEVALRQAVRDEEGEARDVISLAFLRRRPKPRPMEVVGSLSECSMSEMRMRLYVDGEEFAERGDIVVRWKLHYMAVCWARSVPVPAAHSGYAAAPSATSPLQALALLDEANVAKLCKRPTAKADNIISAAYGFFLLNTKKVFGENKKIEMAAFLFAS